MKTSKSGAKAPINFKSPKSRSRFWRGAAGLFEVFS